MMYGGFTYHGKHSFDDYGLIVQTVNRPLLAPQKTVQTERAGDGQNDYTAANIRQRAFFDNKTLTVECKYETSAGYRNLQTRTARIAAWLSNAGGSYTPLVFDDMPMVAWSAKPASGIPIEFQWATMGSFRITFDCEPFNSYIFDSSNIPLDADIPLDSEFQLGGPIDVGSDITYFNTSAPSLPVIHIKGGGSNLTVSCNGYTISYNEAWGGEFVIDCATETAWLNNNMVEVDGIFFEFAEGDNTLQVTGTNLAGTVEAVYPFNVYYGEEK